MFKEEFGNDFTLKEFWTPRDVIEANNLTKEESVNNNAYSKKPCILCLRNDTLACVLRARGSGTSCPIVSNASRIHNYVGIPGEYFIDHCICSSSKRYEGLIDPVVLPIKSYFEPIRLDGLRSLRQTIPKPSITNEVF